MIDISIYKNECLYDNVEASLVASVIRLRLLADEARVYQTLVVAEV